MNNPSVKGDNCIFGNNVGFGYNTIIGNNCSFGNNVSIGHNCIIEDGVVLGDNVFIAENCIIRSNVEIGEKTTIGANCILGEWLADFFLDRTSDSKKLIIGDNSIIRSGTKIYGGSLIGSFFQTGHNVTIREGSRIGNHSSIGTLSDIQGNCEVGDYVRLHSNVHIGQLSKIDSYVWIFPYVVLTNDPTPPSEKLVGVHVHSFAIIATNAIILPGIDIAEDCLIAACANVTKNVERYQVVGGNPAKVLSDIRNIKNKFTGEAVYPWRYHFDRGMPWENIGYEEWCNTICKKTDSIST